MSTSAEIEAKFWLSAKQLLLASFSPMFAVAGPWLGVASIVLRALVATTREVRWIFSGSRSTALWFWTTYCGLAAYVAARYLLGPSVYVALNNLAMLFIIFSFLLMWMLWVSRWTTLCEQFVDMELERLKADASSDAVSLK